MPAKITPQVLDNETPHTRVWCARACYRVVGSTSDVLGMIQDKLLDPLSTDFVWLSRDNGVLILLAVKHISALEPA